MIFFFTGERKDVYVLAQEYLGSIYRYITDTVVSSYTQTLVRLVTQSFLHHKQLLLGLGYT